MDYWCLLNNLISVYHHERHFDALSLNKLICSETLDGKNSCLFIDDETSDEKWVPWSKV